MKIITENKIANIAAILEEDKELIIAIKKPNINIKTERQIIFRGKAKHFKK